jgi:hypothetical protein
MLSLFVTFPASQPASLLTCSWTDLLTTDCVTRALQLDGAVAVSSVPGLASARVTAFSATADCLQHRPDEGQARMLDDGTIRRTIGARTILGASEPLGTMCEDVSEATDTLRAIVDQASRRFTRALDPLLRPGASLPTGAASLTELVHGAEHLEHFHAYYPKESGSRAAGVRPTPSPSPVNVSGASDDAAARPPALPLHTDAGLFITIVPALLLRLGEGAADQLGTKGLAAHQLATRPSARAAAAATSRYASHYGAEEIDVEADGGADDAGWDGFYVERADGRAARLSPQAEVWDPGSLPPDPLVAAPPEPLVARAA